MKEIQRRHYKKHQDKIRAKSRAKYKSREPIEKLKDRHIRKLWRLSNPEKMKEYKKKYYEKYREKVIARSQARYYSFEPAVRKRIARNHSLKIEYGITLEKYQEMLDSQNGVCFICKKSHKKTLHVDHNHSTGAVRKLLCVRCNMIVAHLENTPELFVAAQRYLEATGQ